MTYGAVITNVGKSFTYSAEQTTGFDSATITSQSVNIQSIYIFLDGFMLRMADNTWRLVGKAGKIVSLTQATGNSVVNSLVDGVGLTLADVGMVRPV